MDIANYLSELLGRYTEISVPGLGCFSRLRVNGYYDDVQATFYPPGHELHFDQEIKDDEVLTRHIAEKKKSRWHHPNISPKNTLTALSRNWRCMKYLLPN